LAEQRRQLIAASPVEKVVDQDGRTWTLKRLPATAQPDLVRASDQAPVRARIRLFSRRIA
jgi:hypothetical protein